MLRGRRRPGARARGARGLRRRVGDRRALLRDGARRGRGHHDARCPAALDTPEERRRIGDELIDALVEIHAVDWQAVRAGGLRQADRLPRAPAAPLHRPVGAQQDARDPGGRDASALAGRQPARVGPGDDRARRLPPRQHDVRGRRARAAGGDPRLGDGTIGDPLADVGYLCTLWVDRDDPPRGMFELAAVTRAEGFPVARRADRALRGAQRALDARRAAGTHARAVEVDRLHGGQLQARGRPARPTTRSSRTSATAWSSSPPAPRRWPVATRKGLLVDFGGVLTTNVFESFAAFCEAEGLEPERVRDAFRNEADGRQLLFDLELGKLDNEDFERRFARTSASRPSGRGPDRAAVRRHEGRPRDGDGRRHGQAPGHQDGADLQLVGRDRLRARPLPRDVRRLA